jgi:hypothetical protein
VISGNAAEGVAVMAGAGTKIEGNLIGTDASGSTALPNGVGVLVAPEASDTRVGTGFSTGNVISGNAHHGVSSAAGRVEGNLIRLDATGAAALPNGEAGVNAFGSIRIGGPTGTELNVIAGHQLADVLMGDAATVQGNRIGLTLAGTELPTDSDVERRNGIRLTAFADGATIGGSGSLEGNIIAGHSIGVESAGPVSGLSVQGNLIGLAADGTTIVPTGTGIRIGADTTGSLIGGTADGAGNTVIADALGTGIAVAGARTRIEGNAIGLDKNDNGGAENVIKQEYGISVRATPRPRQSAARARERATRSPPAPSDSS